MSVPTFTTQPAGATVNAGDSTTLRAVAYAGGVAPGYQWYRLNSNGTPGSTALADGSLFTGTTTGALRIANMVAAIVGLYACVASTQDGSTSSNVVAVLLTGMVLPKIGGQPAAVTVAAGGQAQFSVAAAGTDADPVSYQWLKNGAPLGDGIGGVSGATGPDLALAGVTHLEADYYQCRIANSAGTLLSNPAALTVTDGGTTYAPQGFPPLAGVVAVTLPTGSGIGGVQNPIYSGAAGAFAAFFAESFDGAGVYPDGDWTTAQPDGMGWIEFPFEGEGDQSAVLVRRRWMQFAYLFAPTPLGTPCPYNAALLLVDEVDFKLEIGGVVSWTRVYATMPGSRDVFESYAYGFQFIDPSPDGTKLTLTEFTAEVTSRVRCEYFHVRDRASWPPLLAPRIIQYGSQGWRKRGQGSLVQDLSSPYFFISNDEEILAEDSKEKIWKYPIMERRSRYIAGPSLGFWGGSIAIVTPPQHS